MATPTPMPAFAPAESPLAWVDTEDAVDDPFAPIAVDELVASADEVDEEDEVVTVTALLDWPVDDVATDVSDNVDRVADVGRAFTDALKTIDVLGSGPKTVENPTVLTTT